MIAVRPRSSVASASLQAAAELVEQLGATVAGFAILVNLKFLPGAEVISRWPAHYVVEFD